jgi:hypothetical protein
MKVIFFLDHEDIDHQATRTFKPSGSSGHGQASPFFFYNRMTRSWSQMEGNGGEESMDRQKGAAKTWYHKTKLAGSQARSEVCLEIIPPRFPSTPRLRFDNGSKGGRRVGK